MLTSRGHHNRGESGQMIAFAMAFIALFTLVSVAVLTYASRTQSQKQHSEVTAQSDSLAEGGALYGVADAFRGDASACPNNSGSLTMEGGDIAGYATRTCPPVSTDSDSLASTCTLCLLGRSGDDLTTSAPISVVGPVAINTGIKLSGSGTKLSSTQIAGAPASTSFIGMHDTSGCGSTADCSPFPATQITPIGDPYNGLPEPRLTGSVDHVSGDAGSSNDVSGNAGNSDKTIPPGIYSSLSTTGGVLTLASGVYVVACTTNCNSGDAISSGGRPGSSIVVGGPSAGRTFGDGTTTNGSPLLLSPLLQASFVAGDVGRTVAGTGIPTGTIIVSWTSAQAVVMSNKATMTGVRSITLGSEPGGALIYLACSNYTPPDPITGVNGSCPTGGQKGTGMSINGNGAFRITPLTSGPYAGIVLFADPHNTSPLSMTGNGSDVSGTVYAASSTVTISGGALGRVGGRLIVKSLTMGVNGQVGSGLNLIGSHSALDNCVVYDDSVYAGRTFAGAGAISNGSTGLSLSAPATFTSADIGRSVSGTGIPVGTTIINVTSATGAVISNSATADGSGLIVLSSPGRAIIDAACGGGPGIADFNYGP